MKPAPNLALSLAEQSAKVSTFGGRLCGYRVGAVELLDVDSPGDAQDASRGDVLAPWPNRIRDGRYAFDGRDHQLPLNEAARHNALHGLVRTLPWTLVSQESARVVLELRLSEPAGYPFRLRLSLAYVLTPGGLEVALTALNEGSTAAPYGVGFHPYLSAGAARIDGALLSFQSSKQLALDDRKLPIGEGEVSAAHDFRRGRPLSGTRLDDCFTGLLRGADGRARVQLQRADGAGTAELWQDEALGYLQLFTGDVLEPCARRRGLAVEPMSCAPDAFNSGAGLVRLAPGARHVARWGLQLRR